MEKLNSSEREYSTDDLRADALYGYDLLMEDSAVASRNGDHLQAHKSQQEALALKDEYLLTFGEKMPEGELSVGQEALWSDDEEWNGGEATVPNQQ